MQSSFYRLKGLSCDDHTNASRRIFLWMKTVAKLTMKQKGTLLKEEMRFTRNEIRV